MKQNQHIPVLAGKVLELLITDRSGQYLDGTCGFGMHSALILKELSSEGTVICIDRDVKMLQVAKENLKQFTDRVTFHHCSYDELEQVPGLKENSLSGVFFDNGMCSGQLDDEQRGFSYRFDAPLDMRFDQTSPVTAEKYLNSVSPGELAEALKSFGDFLRPRKLVERIIDHREHTPLRSVGDLISCVEDIFPKASRNKHLSRLLQSIRMAINNETETLDRALPKTVKYLKPGGRLVVISYHSQEDRRVKRFIRQSSRESGFPPEIEAGMKGKSRTLRSVTRRAVKPAADEIERNPRARSARLRVAEKLSFS